MTSERARSWRAGKHRTGSDGEVAPQFFGPVAVGDDASVAYEAEEYGEFQYPLEHDGLLRLNDECIVFARHDSRFDPHQFRIATAALPRALRSGQKKGPIALRRGGSGPKKACVATGSRNIRTLGDSAFTA
jgi:hypothetical protein